MASISNSVRFACTALVGVNKVGKLKKDENGYYEMTVGALNVFNGSGEFYEYERARDLFTSSSHLMRRVSNGQLRGEYGHPKLDPQKTRDQNFTRMLTIDEKSCCCHHKEIFLDMDRVKDDKGRPVIAIVSKVLPSGPYGDALAKQLQNPDENVCFSIRSFTDDFLSNGVYTKILKTIVTWDYVNDPGIASATKYKTPSLEGLFENRYSRREVQELATGKSQALEGLSMEGAVLNAAELMHSFGWDLKSPAPVWNQW